MGTGGPQNFDMQNFFKGSSASPPPPYNLPNHPNHPYHPSSNAFPQNSYPASSPSPGSFPFPSQGHSGMYSYMHYPQEHVPRPAQYPSGPFIQTPFSQSMVATSLPQSSTGQVPQPSVSSPTLDGARLMALLTTQSTGDLRLKDESSAALLSHPSSLELPPAAVSSDHPQSAIESSEAPPAISPALPTAPPVSLAPPSSSTRASMGKPPRGRHLTGERVVYDIDNRLPGEAQPQLEVSPITVYSSDPVLVVGRQIAVNKSYICYGLRAGTIRILNINTASRNLLRGHSQRVTDMEFLADEVHVLASASTEGKVFVRKIVEGPGDDGKNQITEQILVAIQFVGDWDSAQPRVCWHPRQDILVVGIGKYVLTVDISRFRIPPGFSPEDAVKCSVKSPVEGVRVLGMHEDDVTGLSACTGTTRFGSSSKDGTVRIWGDTQLAILAPHSMSPVNSVAFLCAPRRLDHMVLLTAGPLNKELKLWASYGADGSNWKCIQTLELKSSLEKKAEDAFFNQLTVVPHASYIMLANAKRNAIYVVHVEFGSTPSSTRLDYLAEFSVKMPILSFTATSDNVIDGEGVMQVYCVQTQAIQQYSLDFAMCLPPVQDGKPDISASDGFANSASGFSVGTQSNVSGPPRTASKITVETVDTSTVSLTYDAVTLSTDQAFSLDTSSSYEAKDVPQKETSKQERSSADSEQFDKAVLPDSSLEGRGEPIGISASAEAPLNSEKEEKDSQNTSSKKQTQPHLITPSELMSMVARSKAEVPAVEDETDDVEARTSLDGESATESRVISENFDEERTTLKRTITDNTEVLLDNLEGGNVEISGDGESLALSVAEETPQVDDTELPDDRERGVGLPLEDMAEQLKEVSSKATEFSASSVSQSPAVSKGRKNKNKASAGPIQVPVASQSVMPEVEATSTSSAVPSEGLPAQVQAMQDTLNQLVAMQKELQKQMSVMVTAPIAKEGKRMETALGQRIEKVLKANVDAMSAKIQEENVKREKAERERMQQLITTLTNSINSNKELPASVERLLKKELAAIGPAVTKLISPSIEKAVATALGDAVQGVSDKTLPQLEKTVSAKLETSVARQLQSQFQTTGRQALQDAMRTCFEGSVVPSFERSCRAMFEQVDAAFQKGMAEHTSHAQQQVSLSHNALASTLQDTVASVNSLAQTLKTDLADGQRKLVALAENANTRYPYSANQSTGVLPEKVLSLQHVEESLDPTIELSRLITQGKLEEAFTKALSRSDVAVVSWLCNQVEPSVVFSSSPPPLSQGVLLSLVQQLGCDLGKDTARKLTWIREAALALNPNDPVLAPHMKPFLDQLYQNLHRQVHLTPAGGEVAASLRLVMHVVNSLLTSCK